MCLWFSLSEAGVLRLTVLGQTPHSSVSFADDDHSNEVVEWKRKDHQGHE